MSFADVDNELRGERFIKHLNFKNVLEELMNETELSEEEMIEKLRRKVWTRWCKKIEQGEKNFIKNFDKYRDKQTILICGLGGTGKLHLQKKLQCSKQIGMRARRLESVDVGHFWTD